ncbi:MAG: mechanosensitive ion channel protein, partial [Pseudoalteromonas sp.]
VNVGVAYDSDVLLVEKLIKQVLSEHLAILPMPASSVMFDDFAESSLVFSAIFWVCAESETMLRLVRSDIRFSIYKIFKENDVRIAFAQRDIHIDGEIALKKPYVLKE